ncbi:MAG TPA: YceI family protein [Chthoniobacterales bacterium]
MSAIPHPIIDVLSADSFAEAHIPGAVNLCIYETAFLDKVRTAFPDVAAALTIYGWDDATREAGMAAEKLTAAGYRNIAVLPGGLEGWKSRGGATERGNIPTRKTGSVRYEVDPAASFVRWTGRNLFNFHTGTLALSSGHVVVENGHLQSGRFTIDMMSLGCSDIMDSALNATLIAHLRSDDFFAVNRFPNADFVISSANLLAGATLGTPNYHIRGDFTLRGVTREIEFPAVIGQQSDGGYTAQAIFGIDRTQWGAIYGSGKFFARLGQHVVNDDIHLHLKVVTTAA